MLSPRDSTSGMTTSGTHRRLQTSSTCTKPQPPTDPRARHPLPATTCKTIPLAHRPAPPSVLSQRLLQAPVRFFATPSRTGSPSLCARPTRAVLDEAAWLAASSILSPRPGQPPIESAPPMPAAFSMEALLQPHRRENPDHVRALLAKLRLLLKALLRQPDSDAAAFVGMWSATVSTQG